MTRPRILDLLPWYMGASITNVTVDGAWPAVYPCLVRDADRVWRVKGRPRIIVDPEDITEFTVHRGENKITWTEGSHPNEWSCIVEGEEES